MRAYSTLIRGLVLVLLGVLGWAGLGAQGLFKSTEVVEASTKTSFGKAAVVCDDDAGEITQFTNIKMSSRSLAPSTRGGSLPYVPYSDSNRDTIFLCRGDQFTLNLDENSVRLPESGDPDPNTPRGIAYTIYDCPPSQTGETREDFLSDACLVSTGRSPFGQDSLVLFSPVDYGEGDYDLLVENYSEETLMEFFPGPDGRPGPKVLFVTPITVDAITIRDDGFGGLDSVFVFEADSTFQCNNQRIDQVTAIGWLNEISIENEDVSSSDCSGSFNIRGGISEFRGTDELTVSITPMDGSGGTANLDRQSRKYGHNDVVNYDVTQPGTYRIEVTDGIGCGFSGEVTHSEAACQAVAEPEDCGADAGRIGQLTNVNIQSSSLGNVPAGGTVDFSSFDNLNDTVFLCLGDEFTIDFSEESETLPSNLESAGIAYHVFGCKPTVSGETRDNLLADPCNFDVPFPFQEGLDVLFPAGYFAGNYDYRIEHAEAPYATQTFNGTPDDPQPVVLTFAPITIDSAVRNGGAIQYENGDCIDVAIESRITIGYLNPIDADLSSGSCSGNFTVTGGKSELSRGGNYTIRITDATGAAVDALEGGATSYRHGDVVNYSFAAAGTYNVSVTDEVSCGFSGQLVVTEVCQEEEEEPTPPVADLTIDATPTDVSCTGDNDGSIVVTASGGTAPYSVTYTRTNPTPRVNGTGEITTDGGSFTFPDLSIGFYDIEVLDADGVVKDTTGIQIDEGAPFDVTIETVPAGDCTNGDLATLVVVVSVDGSRLEDPTDQGYSISWSSGETTDTISATPNETYTVTVRNIESDCPNRASTTPSRPSTLVIDITNSPTVDATCSGSLDGSATVQVTGGVPDDRGEFQFDWSDGFSARGNRRTVRASLNPGPYTVTVTDVNGCDDSFTFNVAAEKTLVATLDSTQVECFGESNGTISVRASTKGAGASLPYRAAVEDVAGTQVAPFQTLPGNGSTPITFEGFAAGQYIVVLQDSDPQQCETRDTITVTEPAELTLAVTTTSPICPEDPDGTAELIVTGGTGPYTFRVINDSLPDPVDSLMTFDTLLVDTNFLDTLQPSPFYIAIIDDANGCGPDSLQFEIRPRPQPRVTNALFTTISCPGDSDGQLSAIVSPPPGDSITITDYAWFRLSEDNSKGEQVAVGRTTEPNLTVGAYLLEVTLSNDCVWPFPGFVDSPGLVSLDSVAITDPTCLGDTDGSIELFAIGGTPNPDGSYNYSWSDLDGPITVATRTGLSADTYSVTISDANNCQPAFETTFEVEDPDGIIGEFTVVEDVSCPNDTTQDGRITFAPRFTNDSIGTFDFFWSTGDTIRGETSSSLSGLARGPISVTVTDGVCPQVFDTIIGSPDEFAFDDIITDATCNGEATGSAEILVTGGTPGYTFSYVDRPEVTNRLDSVPAGEYQLLVTDSRGCEADTTFTISQPDSLILAIDPFLTTPRVTCFGDEDGVLAVQVVSTNNNSFGDSPYSWSPAVAGGNESSASELAPGTYGVTVTDEAGCQDSLSYTIFEPDPIGFVVDTIADPLCFNDPAEITLDTAFGGQGTDLLDYSFTINNDGFLTPFDQVGLGFGDSVVISVFDSVGCFSEQTFQIQQPDEIVIDLPNRLLVELGDSLTQLNPLISPGGRDYRYRWTAPRFEPPVPFLSNDSIRDPFLLTPTQSVEYTLTVTDENGCQAIDDIFVEIDANRNVFIPNVFSPNMDGRNDDFRIYACTGVVGITKVNIFNRWGGLLFERENIPSSCLDGTLLWDGRTPEGREVDPGVYVYTVEVLFIDGVTLLYRGDIAVVR